MPANPFNFASAVLASALVVASCAGGPARAAHCEGSPDLDIWVTGLDGNARPLVVESGADGFAVWSPDGSQFAFVASRDGNCEIYVADADGSNQRNLTNSGADELYPSWSPDGSEIVFASDEADGAELFVVDVSSAKRRQITDSGFIHNYPDWSPDGLLIAYTGGNQPAGPDTAHNVYLVTLDTGREEQLTVQGELILGPQWSPEGDRISYFDHDGPLTIWVMDADGFGTTEVVDGGFHSWSPEGDALVFDREVAEGDVDVFTVVFGGEPQLLVDGPGFDTLPSWSPSGEMILFSTDRP